MLLILYWVMTLCCCVYAASAGGLVGRIGAVLIIFKTVAGFYTALLDQRWSHTFYQMLAVDVICLTAFLTLAFRSNRHWPLWTSGCAFAAVMVHLASMMEIGLDPKIYHGLRSLWAIPMQLYMVRGIRLDERYRRLGSKYFETRLTTKLTSKIGWRR